MSLNRRRFLLGLSAAALFQPALVTKVCDSQVSVIDFGADPNGVRDSTDAIVRAARSLPSGGGTVLLAPGTYKVSPDFFRQLGMPDIVIRGETERP